MNKGGDQYKKRRIRVWLGIWCIFILGITGISNVQASDAAGRIEGKDSVYVSGTYQPKAETSGDADGANIPEEDGNFLNIYRSGRAAYYGAQLNTENEQRIYTILAEKSRKNQIKNVDGSNGTITIRLPEKVKLPAAGAENSAAYKKFYSEVGKSVDAFLFDYSENYWIYGYRWTTLTENDGATIYGITIWFADYYDGIKSEDSSVQAELNRLLNKITGNSRYEIVRQIYEEVIKLVEYPPEGRENYMPYHTITGGLLGKYGHQGVCDCYARIFRLLCQKKGIACIMVPGGSEMENGKVKVDHIWNYVQMENGKWYLIDCTWDDVGTDTPEMTHFLAGSETSDSYSETVGETHMAVGIFTDSNYQPFTVPKLSAKAYTDQIQMVTEPQKITLSKTSLGMYVGDVRELSATMTPNASATDKLEWKSSDNSVLDITDVGGAGKAYVTAKKAGKADITVSYKNKVFATCHITVSVKKPAVVYKIKLNVTSLPLQLKKSTNVLKVVSCSPGDSVKEWKSSNAKCVKVDKKTGKLTALRSGTAMITVISNKGATASCKVTVKKGTIATQKLALKKTTLTLKKGKRAQIQLIRTPLTATDKLSYKSSNNKVAAVSANGSVRAKKKGTATITIRSASGKTVKLKIKVNS